MQLLSHQLVICYIITYRFPLYLPAVEVGGVVWQFWGPFFTNCFSPVFSAKLGQSFSETWHYFLIDSFHRFPDWPEQKGNWVIL